MSKPFFILGLTFLWLHLPGCTSPPIKQDIPPATKTTASSTPVLSDPKRNEAILAELQQLGTIDPDAHQRLMENLGKSDPSIWPLVIQQFRATEAYRQRVRQRESLAMQNTERLPPVEQNQVAHLISTAADPLGKVVQASYPAPQTSRQLPGSKQLTLCNLAFCTEILGYGSCRRCEDNSFKPGQEILLYAEVEEFRSTATPRGYRTALKSTYRILDAEGRCLVDKTYEPTEDYCQNLRCDFFIGYRIVMPKDLLPGTYRLLLAVEDLEGRQTAESEIVFSIHPSQ